MSSRPRRDTATRAHPDPATGAPLFILGTQRSGTTLVCTILNRHPELYVANELSWLIYRYVAGKPVRRARLERDLERHGDPPALGPFTSLADRFGFLERLMSHRMQRAGKRRWGIKQPHLTYYLSMFADHFRSGRFVIMVRDPRATSLSLIRQKSHVANAYHGGLLWKREIEIQKAFVEQHRERSLVVGYEKLIAAPEHEVRRICDHFDLDYGPELLEANSGESLPFRVHPGNINVTRPIDREIAERWRCELTERQCAVIEHLAGEDLMAFGYEPVSGPVELPRWRRRLYELHQFVMQNYWWQKQARILPLWSGLKRRFAGVDASPST